MPANAAPTELTLNASAVAVAAVMGYAFMQNHQRTSIMTLVSALAYALIFKTPIWNSSSGMFFFFATSGVAWAFDAAEATEEERQRNLRNSLW